VGTFGPPCQRERGGSALPRADPPTVSADLGLAEFRQEIDALAGRRLGELEGYPAARALAVGLDHIGPAGRERDAIQAQRRVEAPHGDAAGAVGLVGEQRAAVGLQAVERVVALHVVRVGRRRRAAATTTAATAATPAEGGAGQREAGD